MLITQEATYRDGHAILKQQRNLRQRQKLHENKLLL